MGCLLLTAADGALPAAAREHARRVLVLYGWNPKEVEKPPALPVDTMTSELFQAPLEWLGYEVEYRDIGKDWLPDKLERRFAAVLVDAEIHIPADREVAFAEWLVEQQSHGAKLLFTGSFPFSTEDAMDALRAGLGVRGSGRPVPKASELRLVTVDATLMNAETKVTPRINDFRDLRAPDKARSFVTLAASDEDGDEVRYDPVFLASWGGAWLEPYIVLRASEDHSPFYADPYKFLAAWLGGNGVFPAPDPSTRDGLRAFYSHIDGDGFPTPAEFGGHPICGEIIRDHILKVFPVPVTVSFIEADLRGQVQGLESADSPHFLKVARSLLALHNVRTASHSYSHPYVWFEDDPNPGVYDEVNLPMKLQAKYPKILAAREVRGSVEYINQFVAPKDKPVELFLWSGNCRPGVEALRQTRELGLENMNGGNTIISRLYPGVAGVAPRVMPWDGELQIHASNQNEFMYVNGFNGPFYAGFAQVIDTFERTETPRRLKPVNVYYHFYSGEHASSLHALEKVYRWCADQNLHSMTALAFAQMTRDSYTTRIYDMGPRHWVMENKGLLRTYRLPSYLGKPDLAHCHGITGWNIAGDQLYLHTDGSPQVELQLTDAEAKTDPGLYLVSSTAEIHFLERTKLKVRFTMEDFRAVKTVFAGLPATAKCYVTVDGKNSQVAADENGRVLLSLPARAQVTLEALTP